MSQQTKDLLKSYFRTGQFPSESNFVDLIDSIPVQNDGEFATGNVKLFGATGNGISDDTEKFQEVIDAQEAENNVFIPPGQYNISSLNMFNKLGMHVHGAGWNSCLILHGPLDSGFNIDGMAMSTFENFRIMVVDGLVDKIIDLKWTGPGTNNRSTSLNVFRNIQLYDEIGSNGFFNWGFAVGTNDNQYANDGNCFYDCWVRGQWDWLDPDYPTSKAAFRFGSDLNQGIGGNNLNHNLYGCTALATKYFLDVKGVNFHCFNSETVRHDTIYRLSGRSNSNSSIIGGNHEGVGRLLDWQNETLACGSLTVQDVTVRGDRMADDGKWIDILENGYIELRNLTAQLIREGVTPSIHIDSWSDLNAHIEGIKQPTDVNIGVVSDNPSTVHLDMHSYIETSDPYTIPVAISYPPNPNLIFNGLMETGNLLSAPTGWFIYGNTVATLQADERTGGTGTKSVDIACITNNYETYIISNLYTLQVGKHYSVEVWMKNIGSTILHLKIYNNDTIEEKLILDGTTASVWTKFSGEFTATDIGFLGLEAVGSTGSHGRFDGVIVKEI